MADRQREAFVEFARRQRPRLLTIATFMTGDRHLAEDVVQNALIKLAARWHRVADQSPEGYVRRVLYTEAVDHARRHRRLEESLGHEHDYASATTRDQFTGIDEGIDLMAQLRRLTPRQRSVLVLRYLEDLSQEQTAQQLGISVGSVTRTTHEALTRLRAIRAQHHHQEKG